MLKLSKHMTIVVLEKSRAPQPLGKNLLRIPMPPRKAERLPVQKG